MQINLGVCVCIYMYVCRSVRAYIVSRCIYLNWHRHSDVPPAPSSESSPAIQIPTTWWFNTWCSIELLPFAHTDGHGPHSITVAPLISILFTRSHLKEVELLISCGLNKLLNIQFVFPLNPSTNVEDEWRDWWCANDSWLLGWWRIHIIINKLFYLF